jgi:calcineurin-like phosphoesterase family protein
MIWFTSDPHFGHEKVIKYSSRPFATVEEMDETLIQYWNSRVEKKDEVWCLGDFVFHGSVEGYRARLNGRIHLVLGNHDRRRLSLLDVRLFESVQDVKYLRWEGLRFWLSHYAHRTWPKSNRGSYHLYGHSHGDLAGNGRSMDVGVDCNDYHPISIEEVVKILDHFPPTNHHTERSIS